jgi:hypothetical protein
VHDHVAKGVLCACIQKSARGPDGVAIIERRFPPKFISPLTWSSDLYYYARTHTIITACDADTLGRKKTVNKGSGAGGSKREAIIISVEMRKKVC